MSPVEAIEPTLLAPGFNLRWSAHLDVFLRVLHALAVSEHPYAYLVATEPQRDRPRA